MSSAPSRRCSAITRADTGTNQIVAVLRADAGREVGLGHVRRADAVAARLGDWARCLLLLDDAPAVRPDTPWRRVAPTAEATVAAAAGENAAALIIDSYSIDVAREATRAAGVDLLVVFDDHGRGVDADVIVSPGLADTDGRLAGPRFAPLAPVFETAPSRTWPLVVERALVVLGGATPAALMATLVRAARRALSAAAIDAVVGPAGDVDSVTRALVGVANVTVHAARADLRPLMLAADVAVTAGGVTLLELAACATPAVAVTLAPNQVPNVRQLAAADGVVPAGDATAPGIADVVEETLRDLNEDRARRRALGEAARGVVDGGGARRVADALRTRLAATRGGELARC
jgi:UDP-2,4-diacetamido-2,4,6-trideoxy-beta-L-altropyranose hydrolase